MNKTKKSGVSGIVWYPRLEKWEVRTPFEDKRIVVGYYSNLNNAKIALSAVRNVLDKHVVEAWV